VPIKNLEVIADRLTGAGWSRGCASTINSNAQTIFVADAHLGDGERLIVRAGEKLTAFSNLNP